MFIWFATFWGCEGMISRLIQIYLSIGLLYAIAWALFDKSIGDGRAVMMCFVVFTWPLWLVIHLFVR